MQMNLLTMLGIGLAVMFFGYFFGLFEGRGQGYKRRKQQEEEEKKTRAAIERPLAPPPVADNSLLKISLDIKQQPQLDLDGQRVDPSRLTADQRKRLMELLVLARPWLDPNFQPKAAAPPPVARPAGPSTPTPAPPVQAAPAAANPKPGPSVTPAAATPPARPEVVAPTTMVGQIDAILQARLAGTPLAARGIRLTESPEGAVTVEVGLERFPSVGEVTDPTIQAIIRAAIAEWEQKYTPT